MIPAFSSIALDDPRLASIPDAPGKAKLAPLGQAGPPKRHFYYRSREQRSPDRQASIERRRMHAACGALPPVMAAKLTTSEQSVCRVLADENLAHGISDLSRNELGARAGVSQRYAERTILKLERDPDFAGWIKVTRRPRSGRKHLTNLIKITSPEWLAWQAHGNRHTRAVRNCEKAKPTFKVRGDKNSPPRAQVDKHFKTEPASNPTHIPNKPAACGGGGRSLRKQE